MSTSSGSSNPSIKVAHKHNDYSCYVHVINKSGSTLQLVNSKAVSGRWAKTSPPKEISPKSSALIELTDPKGPHGSEGWCKYRLEHPQKTNSVSFTLRFRDPYWARDDNFLQATTSYSKWVSLNVLKYQTNGHPFIAYVEIDTFEHQGVDRRISHRSQKSMDTTISELSGFSDTQGLPEYEVGSHSSSIVSEKKIPTETVQAVDVECHSDDDDDNAPSPSKVKVIVSFHDENEHEQDSQDREGNTVELGSKMKTIVEQEVEEWPEKASKDINSKAIEHEDADVVVQEPSVDNVEKSEAVQSSVVEPEVVEPEVEKSEVEKSEVEKSEVEKSEVEKSEVEKSEVEQSEAKELEIKESTVEEPTPVTTEKLEDETKSEYQIVEAKPSHEVSKAKDEIDTESKVDAKVEEQQPSSKEVEQENDEKTVAKAEDETHKVEHKIEEQSTPIAEAETEPEEEEIEAPSLTTKHEEAEIEIEPKELEPQQTLENEKIDLEAQDDATKDEPELNEQPTTIIDNEVEEETAPKPAVQEPQLASRTIPEAAAKHDTTTHKTPVEKPTRSVKFETHKPQDEKPTNELQIKQHTPELEVQDTKQEQEATATTKPQPHSPEPATPQPEVKTSHQTPTTQAPPPQPKSNQNPTHSTKDSNISEPAESSYWTTILESPNTKIGAVALIFLASYGFTALRVSRGLMARNG